MRLKYNHFSLLFLPSLVLLSFSFRDSSLRLPHSGSTSPPILSTQWFSRSRFIGWWLCQFGPASTASWPGSCSPLSPGLFPSWCLWLRLTVSIMAVEQRQSEWGCLDTQVTYNMMSLCASAYGYVGYVSDCRRRGKCFIFIFSMLCSENKTKSLLVPLGDCNSSQVYLSK